MFALRHLGDGGLQVAEQLRHRRVVRGMERREFVEDVMAALDARVAKDGNDPAIVLDEFEAFSGDVGDFFVAGTGVGGI